MKSTAFTLILFCFSTFLAAQSVKDYDLRDFESVDVGGAFYVEIKQDINFKVQLECDEKYMDKIDIHMHGNDLKIKSKSMNISSGDVIKVFVNLPILKNLECSGASDMKLIGMEQDKMNVETSGASSLRGDLDVKEIQIDASGASSVGLSGRAQKMSLYLSGASEFLGKGFLISDEFLADFSGASSANCQVEGDMFVKLSGASKLEYHGSGDIIKQETSGASSIIKD